MGAFTFPSTSKKVHNQNLCSCECQKAICIQVNCFWFEQFPFLSCHLHLHLFSGSFWTQQGNTSHVPAQLFHLPGLLCCKPSLKIIPSLQHFFLYLSQKPTEQTQGVLFSPGLLWSELPGFVDDRSKAWVYFLVSQPHLLSSDKLELSIRHKFSPEQKEQQNQPMKHL